MTGFIPVCGRLDGVLRAIGTRSNLVSDGRLKSRFSGWMDFKACFRALFLLVADIKMLLTFILAHPWNLSRDDTSFSGESHLLVSLSVSDPFLRESRLLQTSTVVRRRLVCMQVLTWTHDVSFMLFSLVENFTGHRVSGSFLELSVILGQLFVPVELTDTERHFGQPLLLLHNLLCETEVVFL